MDQTGGAKIKKASRLAAMLLVGAICGAGIQYSLMQPRLEATEKRLETTEKQLEEAESRPIPTIDQSLYKEEYEKGYADGYHDGCDTTSQSSDSSRNNINKDANIRFVYVTDSGTKYHRSGCRYLSSSSHLMMVSEAKASGYTPCSWCDPPA